MNNELNGQYWYKRTHWYDLPLLVKFLNEEKIKKENIISISQHPKEEYLELIYFEEYEGE